MLIAALGESSARWAHRFCARRRSDRDMMHPDAHAEILSALTAKHIAVVPARREDLSKLRALAESANSLMMVYGLHDRPEETWCDLLDLLDIFMEAEKSLAMLEAEKCEYGTLLAEHAFNMRTAALGQIETRYLHLEPKDRCDCQGHIHYMTSYDLMATIREVAEQYGGFDD